MICSDILDNMVYIGMANNSNNTACIDVSSVQATINLKNKLENFSNI